MRTWGMLFCVMWVGCASHDASTDCRDLQRAATPECAPPANAPTFGGVQTLAPDESGARFRATWQPATSPATDAGALRYRVYASIHAGHALEAPPVLTTDPGATAAWVDAQPTGVKHYVVVRAVDPSGVEDGNVVEKSLTLTADATAPTFGGVTGADPAPAQGVTLRWSAASDDLTPPDGIAYRVYGGVAAVDFTRPLAEAPLGATTITLTAQGAPGDARVYAVRARDAAGHEDGNTAIATAKVGANVVPPVFGGCDTIATPDPRTVVVTWKPATDDLTPPSAIRYEVFVAATPGGEAFDAPTATTTGETTATLSVSPGSRSYVVCRARDESGNSDGNTVEKSVQTSGDVTPPTFAGLTAATVDAANFTVDLAWAAATDDTSAASAIVYEVFEATASQQESFAAPAAVTAPGALGVHLDRRRPGATLYWVVRARDEAHNTDANTVEMSGAMNVSFEGNVQPILSQNCAVVGCHVPATHTGGLILASAFAYGNVVGVNATEKPPGATAPMLLIAPGDPSNSYLYRKIMGAQGTIIGSQMPAPGTGNTLSDAQKALVQSWIQQGAPNN